MAHMCLHTHMYMQTLPTLLNRSFGTRTRKRESFYHCQAKEETGF